MYYNVFPGAKVGSILVVGGGISGVQAALDCAELGFKVYLVEKGPSIGGHMSLLDKTFPTNDCSMCILSPKLSDCERNPNIEILTMSEVREVDGILGHYRVRVRNNPRYVDPETCTVCGECVTQCPKFITDPYNQDMELTKAVHVHFPQAIPSAAYIDERQCLYKTEKKCGICESVCPQGSINLDAEPEDRWLDVGSIIISSGYSPFDPAGRPELGYGRYPNVMTSLEFERMLSASGPSNGHLIRPGDGKEVKRVAWIQCVGSRDRSRGKEYCSSVCCLYATKQAVLTKEHLPGTDTSIFLMDMRAYGKGFDRYYERARQEVGVRYVRSVPSMVYEQEDGSLALRYHTPEGGYTEEEFDVVVLSVGLSPGKDLKQLSETCWFDLNEHGFARSIPFHRVESSRPGVLLCGTVGEPKGIPGSVMQASAAAGEASLLLNDVRGNELVHKPEPVIRELDPEEEPRIGVFVCCCGNNISGTVAVSDVSEQLKELPGVAFADTLMFACAKDSQRSIQDMIEKHDLNRIIVAACSPKFHFQLFREAAAESGLNPSLVDMVNIREQCSWVHKGNGDAASRKALDLVRMTVAKIRHHHSLSRRKSPVTKSALIVGAGLAGMIAALDLAEQGFEVFMADRWNKLGGSARRYYTTAEGHELQIYTKELVDRVAKNPNIHVFLQTTVEESQGYVGNFQTTLVNHRYNVDFCLKHGVTIITTGAEEYKPTEYGYGFNENIMTGLELQEVLLEKPELPKEIKSVAFIHCVGSRDEERPYCSRSCCSLALQKALFFKKMNPKTEVSMLYRDIRTYGFKEGLYSEARRAGIRFYRFEPGEKPEVESNGDIKIKVLDQNTGKDVELHPDLLVLMSATIPDRSNKPLSQLFKVPLDQDGFFLEAHLKLRPVDFSTEGIFMCGRSHGPKTEEETVIQAKAAAARAGTVLVKDELELDPEVARVTQNCDGCALCVDTCSFGAIDLTQFQDEEGRTRHKIEVQPAKCKGCGVCAATCPKGGVEVGNLGPDNLRAMVHALLEDINEQTPAA